MALPNKYNQIISLADASNYTRDFRQANPNAVKAGGFFKEYVEQVIDQPACVAMRVYYGQDKNQNPVLVLVGVDKDGKDLSGGAVAEVIWPCPPWCDSASPLNG